MKRLDAGTPTVLRTRGLCKSYGKLRAVESVNLELRRGEIYGFLGRNGAGKTTTIRMLLGLARPTKGEIEIFGRPLGRDRLRLLGRIGCLVEGAAAYPNLTVRENLDLQRRLTRAPRESVRDAIRLLGLEAFADRRAGRLSLGNKQRLSLARALLHSPELLILDEPANALDPAGIVEIRELLRRLAKERGVAIFMSSHILAEIDQLADRIGIIHQGSLVEELDYETFRDRGRHFIELEVGDAAAAESVLRKRLGLREISRGDANALRVADPQAEAAAIAKELVLAGIELRRLLPVQEDLERHFMRLTGGVA